MSLHSGPPGQRCGKTGCASPADSLKPYGSGSTYGRRTGCPFCVVPAASPIPALPHACRLKVIPQSDGVSDGPTLT